MATVAHAVATLIPPTDEPFITLVENQFAVAAVERLVEADPGIDPRLVYLYGPAGIGKSHLVRQFLWHERQRPAELSSVALTASELIAKIDESAGAGLLHELREQFLKLDLFVCEDIAALERKPESQRFVIAVIDETLANGGRVLLTGSKAAGELESVTPRLINRVHGGVCAGLSPVASTSRVQLLAHFARMRHVTIPGDALQVLADRLPVSPRELRSTVGKLDEVAQKNGSTLVNRLLAERFLDDAVASPAPGVAEVAKAVAKQFGVTVTALRTGGRAAATSLPRQIAMSLARELTGQPLERIAMYFGRQNHGTVIHARKKLAVRLEEDAALRRNVAQIRRRLGVAGR